jgi:hypothetical protein
MDRVEEIMKEMKEKTEWNKLKAYLKSKYKNIEPLEEEDFLQVQYKDVIIITLENHDYFWTITISDVLYRFTMRITPFSQYFSQKTDPEILIEIEFEEKEDLDICMNAEKAIQEIEYILEKYEKGNVHGIFSYFVKNFVDTLDP